MNVTIQSSSLCAGGGHRTIVTDKGTFMVSPQDIEEVMGELTIAEAKERVLVIIKHQYQARRAAGRNHNQAMNDLIGFVVRL